MLIDKLERAFVRLVLFFFGSLKVVGLENIPATGPYILAVNHMSKADPPLVMISWPPMAKIRFFAGEKWEKHLIFGPLMRHSGAIYINRGEVDRRALRQALAALGDGAVFGLAPEGTRSRVGALIQARDGAAYLASRADVPIVPVGMVNTDLLGHNMAHLRRTYVETRIGAPFRLPETVPRPKGDELAACTHLIMIQIAALLPERYWGYYADSPALEALLMGDDPWPACLEVTKATVPQAET
ncbi:MAG: 1-acyl-sn-glycerol-3-phosphate acyltransferase [Chloroflexota bacterium]|nr:MAG: 1-acyl-sn-glycerol-3-phosphate acyltransferase [Chloroflexota bacterium]